MKILLISGHGAGDSGAVGCGYKEAELTRTATSILEGKLKAYDVAVTRYPTSHDAYQDRRNGNYAVSLLGFNLVIEVHFNSYNKSAHGVETLYRNAKCKGIANAVTNAIAPFGFTNRGSKVRTDLANMNYCYRNGVPYILIETCFIDNAEDMSRYKAHIYNIWGKVASAVCAYYGIKEFASNGQSVTVNKPNATKPQTPQTIAVDGSWGKETTKATQKFFKTAIDGIVSNQPTANRQYLPGCSVTSWEFKKSGFGGGSAMVRALQKMVGASVDGYCGKQTVRALQKYLGITVDGYCGVNTVKAWQRFINTKVK